MFQCEFDKIIFGAKIQIRRTQNETLWVFHVNSGQRGIFWRKSSNTLSNGREWYHLATTQWKDSFAVKGDFCPYMDMRSLSVSHSNVAKKRPFVTILLTGLNLQNSSFFRQFTLLKPLKYLSFTKHISFMQQSFFKQLSIKKVIILNWYKEEIVCIFRTFITTKKLKKKIAKTVDTNNHPKSILVVLRNFGAKNSKYFLRKK